MPTPVHAGPPASSNGPPGVRVFDNPDGPRSPPRPTLKGCARGCLRTLLGAALAVAAGTLLGALAPLRGLHLGAAGLGSLSASLAVGMVLLRFRKHHRARRIGGVDAWFLVVGLPTAVLLSSGLGPAPLGPWAGPSSLMHNALWLSVVPLFAVLWVGLLGDYEVHEVAFIPLLSVGLCTGWGAHLLALALTRPLDVAWMPGAAGALDGAWLGAHAAVAWLLSDLTSLLFDPEDALNPV